LSHFFMEETLGKKKPGQKEAEMKPKPTPEKEFPVSELDRSIDEEAPKDLEKKRLTGQEFGSLSKRDQISYMFNQPNITKLIFIFGINTFYAAVIGELIPFWVAAKYKDGGLGFDYHDISHVYVFLTFPQLILQIFLYPYLQKGRGDFWLLTVGHIAHIPMFFFLPFGHMFGDGATLAQKTWIIWWHFVRNVASFMNFSALQRFTNDCIAADKRGKINGFQITFSSMLQTAGPILGGFVLSWSMANGWPYPFNYHLVFLLMVLITLFVLKIIYKLDFVDKDRKKIKGEDSIGL